MEKSRQNSTRPQVESPLFPAVLEGNPEGRMLDVALAYAAAGIPVFPCYEADESKVNTKTGEVVSHKTKSPRTVSGFKDATTDTKRIAAWWKDWPRAMVGMPTAGLVVVDLDVPKPKRTEGGELIPPPENAPNGAATWKRLLEKWNGGKPLEGVPTVRTASGGFHLFFRMGEGPMYDKVKLGVSVPTGLEGPGEKSGIDIRTGGGYVVAAGSRTAEGKAYELLSNPAGGPPPLPDWLLRIATKEAAGNVSLLSAAATGAEIATPTPTPRPAPNPDAGRGFVLPEPTREEAKACKPYGLAALRSACRKIQALQEGERHHYTLRYSVPIFNLVTGGELSCAYAEKCLFAAAKAMDRPELNREILSALRDAKKVGLLYPRTAPLDWNGEAVAPLEDEAPAPAEAVVTDTLQEWQPIEPFSVPLPDPMPGEILQLLPPTIREFVPELSEYVGVPVELALFSCLAFRAISIQGIAEVCYGPKASTVNVFCVPILETGERKSSALKVIISDFFKTFEKDLLEKYQDLRRKAKSRNASLEAKITALTRSIGKDTTRAERLQVNRKKAELEAQLVSIPSEPRFYSQDATVEILGGLTASNCGRMAVVEAEGTFLEILEGRYSNGAPRYEFILKAYSGEPYKYDRKTSGESLSFCPVVTLFLSVQSNVLRERKNKAAARGRGFDARCFFFYPPTVKGYRRGLDETPHVYAHGKDFYQLIREAFWLDPVQYRQTSLEAFLREEEAEAKTAVRTAPATGELSGVDLSDVEPMPWKWEAPERVEVRFSKAAFQVLKDYHAREEWELRPGGENADIADWACRKTESVARLACILHSLRPVPQDGGPAKDFRSVPIGPEDTRTAMALVDWLGQQYRFVSREFLGGGSEDETPETVTRALQVLEKAKAATKGMQTPAVAWRTLFQACRRFMTREAFEKTVNALTLRHFFQQVRPAQEGNERRGRKVQPTLFLNPEARRIKPLLSDE